jgi:L-iditol 2-dehydrogenase
LIPATTTAVRLTGPGSLEQVELPIPEPGPGEVLLQVSAVGLCGSDSHWFREGGIGDAAVGQGRILGHEFSAVIATGPEAGKRVAVDPAVPCQVCDQCIAGRPNLCRDLLFAGHDADGALRGHMVWPEWCLVPLPDALPDEQGALLEPLGVALHAIDLAGPIGEASLAVIGCGPIGLLLMAALRDLGVGPIVATDPIAHRLDAASDLGATSTVTTPESDEDEDPLADSASGGFDVVFETAGSDEALHRALSVARPGGRIILVGIPDGDRTSFAASLARRKELTISLCRRMLPGDLARAAVLAERGIPGLERLVTHRFELKRAQEAFDTLVMRSGIKVMVTP